MGDVTVFISWSGERSRRLAEALKEWIPAIVPAIRTWVSDCDVEKGTLWPHEILKGLSEAHFGIACLTRENLDSPWMLFEAGALSTSVGKRLFPLLLDVRVADLRPPLSLLQASGPEAKDLLALVHQLNQASAARAPVDEIDQAFWRHWTELRLQIGSVAEMELPVELREGGELLRPRRVRSLGTAANTETNEILPIVNISESGALLETSGPLPVGDRLDVVLSLKRHRVPVTAQVVRVQHPGWGRSGGVGVRFVRLDDDSRQIIGNYVLERDAHLSDRRGAGAHAVTGGSLASTR